MTKPEGYACSLDDIKAAAARINSHVINTPLLENRLLNQLLAARVLIKAECLQHAGAFKYRGAINHILQLDAAEREAGVFAWSSGNHAQGVAAAAQGQGVKATILMPEDAPKIKVSNTRGYGAEVIFYDRYSQNREDIGRKLAAELGASIIAPYDNPRVIAGQGTVGLEILEQTASADMVLAPCGGGGLCAGSSMAIRAQRPEIEFYAVEPEAFDDTRRSLQTGERQSADSSQTSICDSIMTPMPGELTFPINQRYLSGGLTVSEQAVRAAVKFAWQTLKLVVEPGGAVALAALLSEQIEIKGKTVVIVLSGGNIDPELFADIIRQ